MNVAFCDGGLCNRLNVLIVALALRAKYGHAWTIGWPQNNWCGAAFDSLFEVDLPVSDQPLRHYADQLDRFQFVMHENQANLPPEALILQSQINGFADLEQRLNSGRDLFYYHNLIPAWANLGDLKQGLSLLRIKPSILQRARDFCEQNQFDGEILGLHIRKTDFGDTVDDKSLFNIVAQSPKRFFVCSDSQEVNERFASLPNCVVFPKQSFPEKMVAEGGWNSTTVDDQGRVFTFNIKRSEDAIVEALIDLLILSRTLHVMTSGSTFLNMSMIFKGTGFF